MKSASRVSTAVFLLLALLSGVCVVACAVLAWRGTPSSAPGEAAPPEVIEPELSDPRPEPKPDVGFPTAPPPNPDSFDDAETGRLSVDTPEKQRVLVPVTQTREQMRRAMADGDPDAIEEVLQMLADGQVPELDFEIPLLEAAVRCLRNKDESAAQNASKVLDDNRASGMRKFLRRICELD